MTEARKAVYQRVCGRGSSRTIWHPHSIAVGAVPVLSKDASSGERGRRSSQVKTPHNPLDSSAPLMKKGKQREIPKAKKPTSLKKVCGLFLWKQSAGRRMDSALYE